VTDPEPLSRREVLDVLRYWLAALRHEEALAVRPRAATKRDRAAPDLHHPGEGQGYFKLVPAEAPGAAAFLLRETRELLLTADGERIGLFERWLRHVYRREQLKRYGGGRDENGPTWLAGFPVVHFAASGELATLLRFVVDDLVWRDEQGKPWAPPRPGRNAPLPDPPAFVKLRMLPNEDEDEAPTYAVDADLLSRTLGVDEERVEEFLGGLREQKEVTPAGLVAAVRDLLLDAAEPGPVIEEPEAAIAALAQAAAGRLAAFEAGRARIYPIGLVYDGTRQHATYHLQRDLQALLQAETLGETRGPLGSYLSGKRPQVGRASRVGLRLDRPPTPDQHAAAERFLGSTLTAVQGPPGTGKTELILDLVAEALVARVRGMRAAGSQRLPEGPLLVVASTNNRAVDNAIDPMGRDAPSDRLPLTLRTGNREVTRTVTVGLLDRVLGWIEAQSPDDALGRFEAARIAFDEAWRAYESGPSVATERAVFEAARDFRERWAVLHGDTLRVVLARVIETARERGSLRPVFEEDAGAAGQWLRRLFPAMGCTLLSLGNVFPMQSGSFERLVIDEAGQCHPAYAIAGLYRADRALIVGDVHQLEPVYGLAPPDEERVRRGLRLGLDAARLAPYRVATDCRTSAQALADRAAGDVLTLRDHFRCQPAIIALSDALCGYDLRVRTPPRTRQSQVPWLAAPVLLRAVQGEQTAWGGSWRNEAEIETVASMLLDLGRRGVSWGDVAVITPYRAQHDALRRRLRSAGIPTDDGDRLAADDLPFMPRAGVTLGTVHRFQGGERSIVVFTTVVTRTRSLQFLNDRVNLVNVAVSRARDHLVVVGDPEALRAGRFTRYLVEQSKPL
jgi:hypothetical protein